MWAWFLEAKVNEAPTTGVVRSTPLDLDMIISNAFSAVECRVSCTVNKLVACGKGVQTLRTRVPVFLEL